MANTPPLSKADKSNFATLQRADRAGDLALMSAIRRVDRKPVALVCAVGHDGVTFAFTPLAVMVEGNPFEDFEPSRSDDPQPPPQQFEPYAPLVLAVREAEEHEIRMARMCRGWRSQPGGPNQAEVREAWAEASRATDAARNALARSTST